MPVISGVMSSPAVATTTCVRRHLTALHFRHLLDIMWCVLRESLRLVTCSPALKARAARDRRGSGIGHRHPPLPGLLEATGLPGPKPMYVYGAASGETALKAVQR